MTITNVYGAAQTSAPAAQPIGRGFGSMDQSDFLKLLTVQMEQQDPFDPVDNKEMLAQMAQFSQLAGISEVNSTLKLIAEKLGVEIPDPKSPGAQAPETQAPGESENQVDPNTQTPADNQE